MRLRGEIALDITADRLRGLVIKPIQTNLPECMVASVSMLILEEDYS